MRSGPETSVVHCSTDVGRRDYLPPERDAPTRAELAADADQDRRHDAWLARQADDRAAAA